MAPGLLQNSASDLCEHSRAKSITSQNPHPKVGDLKVSTFAKEEDLIIEIIRSLKLAGGCLVRGMYDQATLDTMEQDIRPHIKSTQKADSTREEFVPSSTKMVTGLLSKSRTYALSVAGNKTWHRVCDHFLSSKLTNSWVRHPLLKYKTNKLTRPSARKRGSNKRQRAPTKHNSHLLSWTRNTCPRPPPRR